VLVVDDEDDIREFLAYNLSKNGYQVEVAADGLEALKLAERFNPHIFVLDIMMPGMSGVELCRKIRAKPEFKDVLITMLTARQEDQIQIEALNVGADDYITKPLKPSVFLSRINALLRRRDIKTNESL
jgi:two-component system alkaline phosphatase synthesis response regulator PhoP